MVPSPDAEYPAMTRPDRYKRIRKRIPIPDIATTQFFPPNVYLVLFLVACALLVATHHNAVDTARVLIEAGADVNAVDNMAGTASLIGLRSRGVTNRPFHTVDAMKRDAELRYRAKEQGLLEKLKEIEGKLKDLQTKETKAGKTVILTADQKSAIENFRRESVALRKELRAVQLSLRQDIDKLDAQLKAINVGLVPALVVIFAITLGLVRRSRSRRHRFADASAH